LGSPDPCGIDAYVAKPLIEARICEFKFSLGNSGLFFCHAVQKISPDTKDKVQLQVVLQQGGANSFHFANPAGRTKQIEERDSVKELLQQLLPRFRRKVNADLEEKNRYALTVYSVIILSGSWKVMYLQEMARPTGAEFW